jgi:hypothetical protein
MQMDQATREAFQTPWELCTPDQRALREKHLPRRTGDAQAEYNAETIRRYLAGESLSVDGRRKARKLLKEMKTSS